MPCLYPSKSSFLFTFLAISLTSQSLSTISKQPSQLLFALSVQLSLDPSTLSRTRHPNSFSPSKLIIFPFFLPSPYPELPFDPSKFPPRFHQLMVNVKNTPQRNEFVP
jgi:hypothetical protein